MVDQLAEKHEKEIIQLHKDQQNRRDLMDRSHDFAKKVFTNHYATLERQERVMSRKAAISAYMAATTEFRTVKRKNGSQDDEEEDMEEAHRDLDAMLMAESTMVDSPNPDGYVSEDILRVDVLYVYMWGEFYWYYCLYVVV